MQRILYIKRSYSGKSFGSKLKNRLYFSGTQGYFEEALHSQFKVKEVSTRTFFEMDRRMIENRYSAVVVNHGADHLSAVGGKEETLIEVAKNTNLPKVLFIGSDKESFMHRDSVLDQYDAVFKRECYKDRDRYDISDANKKKLYTTMLSCPLLSRPRSRLLKPLGMFKALNTSKELPKEYDVFFLGPVTKESLLRYDVWERLVNEGFRTYGGVYTRDGNDTHIPDHLRGKKVSQQEFLDAARKAKINLALDGVGGFTFRHLELWYLGEFMLSSPSIRNSMIPLPVKEGIHYISYDDLDDLVEKVRYYLENDTERKKIARAGKVMFDQHYDPHGHGLEIKRVVGNLLKRKG